MGMIDAIQLVEVIPAGCTASGTLETDVRPNPCLGS